VSLVRGDVSDLASLERTMADHEVTHVVHLAALLVPFVRDDPPRGALVNVVGTTNVLEAARRVGARGVAYASSAAIYGPDDGSGPDDARSPATLYGVFKRTNEETARLFWQDHGLASVGLRPYVVYGPGRDIGITADPSLAMAAAARGEPYHIGWGGRCQFQYAPDVARAFVAAARTEQRGAHAFNLGGPVSPMSEVVAAIDAAAPEMAGRITFDDVQLPFPEGMDAGVFAEVVGDLPQTSLEDGVRETIELYRRHRRAS